MTPPELVFADVVDGWRVVVTKAIARGASGEPPSLDEIVAIASDLVSGKAGGTGLGLSLVAKIVGEHGVGVECDSEPGRTEFRVLLPLHRGGEDAT